MYVERWMGVTECLNLPNTYRYYTIYLFAKKICMYILYIHIQLCIYKCIYIHISYICVCAVPLHSFLSGRTFVTPLSSPFPWIPWPRCLWRWNARCVCMSPVCLAAKSSSKPFTFVATGKTMPGQRTKHFFKWSLNERLGNEEQTLMKETKKQLTSTVKCWENLREFKFKKGLRWPSVPGFLLFCRFWEPLVSHSGTRPNTLNSMFMCIQKCIWIQAKIYTYINMYRHLLIFA